MRLELILLIFIFIFIAGDDDEDEDEDDEEEDAAAEPPLDHPPPLPRFSLSMTGREVTAVVPQEGVHVLHLFYRVEQGQWAVLSGEERIAAKTALTELVQEISSTPDTQLLVFAMKQAAGRPQDRIDIAALEAIKRLREA